MNVIKIDKEELSNFLDYILDKVEYCYEEEAKKAVENFKKRNGTKWNTY